MALGTNDKGELTYSLAYHIASTLEAMLNCERSGNTEWEARHRAKLEDIERIYLPSGSGIDSGTTIDLERSAPDKLVLETSYHHMDDGYYNGWTEHTVKVRPTFCGIDVYVGGRNRNDIRSYLFDVFHETLSREYPMSEFFRVDEGLPLPARLLEKARSD